MTIIAVIRLTLISPPLEARGSKCPQKLTANNTVDEPNKEVRESTKVVRTLYIIRFPILVGSNPVINAGNVVLVPVALPLSTGRKFLLLVLTHPRRNVNVTTFGTRNRNIGNSPRQVLKTALWWVLTLPPLESMCRMTNRLAY